MGKAKSSEGWTAVVHRAVVNCACGWKAGSGMDKVDQGSAWPGAGFSWPPRSSIKISSRRGWWRAQIGQWIPTYSLIGRSRRLMRRAVPSMGVTLPNSQPITRAILRHTPNSEAATATRLRIWRRLCQVVGRNSLTCCRGRSDTDTFARVSLARFSRSDCSESRASEIQVLPGWRRRLEPRSGH